MRRFYENYTMRYLFYAYAFCLYPVSKMIPSRPVCLARKLVYIWWNGFFYFYYCSLRLILFII